jgi:hypothetical protein
MTDNDIDLIPTLDHILGEENVIVIDESYKFEQEDPMEHDEQWVVVARRWTAIWDEVPMPGIGVDEADAKAKSELYDQLHYDAFRAEFPTWDFRQFESRRMPNLSDSLILQLWTDDGHDYWLHLEASEDAPFWLLTQYGPADFDNLTIYTFNGKEG